MSQYLGEIKAFAFNTVPSGWVTCNGQALTIVDNQALFDLIGTTYGGDGVTTFNLPDLNGRSIVGSTSTSIGEAGGFNEVNILAANLPNAPVTIYAALSANSDEIEGNVLASSNSEAYAARSGSNVAMASGVIQGGNQALNITNPYLTLNYCISLTGI